MAFFHRRAAERDPHPSGSDTVPTLSEQLSPVAGTYVYADQLRGRRPRPAPRAADVGGLGGGSSMSDSSDGAWENAAADPDPADDLGYEHDPLTAIHVDEDREQYIFLPAEEAHLTDAEFIIVPPDDVHRLADWR